MKATELIGKLALRTKPVQYGNGTKDNSYGDEPMLILKATDTHILYKRSSFGENTCEGILNHCWCDDGWTDFEELAKGTDLYKEYADKLLTLEEGE